MQDETDLLTLTVTWGGDPEDLLITEEGVSDEQPVTQMKDVFGDRYRPDLLVLIDARRSDYTRVSSDLIGSRVDSLFSTIGTAPDLRFAVVVGPSVEFGLWRAWGSMVESRVGAQVHVTESLDDARDWLRAEREARAEPV